MLDALTEHALKEWRVTKGAPVAFAACVLLLGILSFVGINWHYSQQLETQKATIEEQRQRIEDQDAILLGYHDENAQTPIPVRSPINSSAPDRTLEDMTNQQLRDSLSKFIAKLRRFQAEFDVKEQSIQSQAEDRFHATFSANKNNKQLVNAKFREMNDQEENKYSLFGAQFNTQFRSGIIEYKRVICENVEFISPCPPSEEARMIDAGFVAGPAPAAAAADYLDSIMALLSK